MITHTLTQGSKDWESFRREFFTASEAPAMLGVSRYKTREELLREKATGITAEVDAHTQARFAAGHEAEAKTRSWAEKFLEEELYPTTGTEVVEGLPLLASFDGINMLETVCWENKCWNEEFAEQVRNGICPDTHWPQLEQQLLISGAEYVLFTISDGAEQVEYMKYTSQPERRAQLIAAWKQFAKDLAEYELPESQPAIVADPVQELPAVSVQVSGQIDVRDNFKVFEKALRDFLENKLIRAPQTDQDFADLDLQIKAMKKAEETLNAAESMMLAQIQSVDEAKRQKDMLTKLVRDNRLMAEKLLEREKMSRRAEKVEAARKAFNAHITELQQEISGIRLDVPIPDFAGAIKGLKTLSSIQDKIDTALANGKIEADQQAADLRTKLAWINENASDHRALLADLQQLVIKPFDYFKLAVMARIDAHKKAQAERLEAERARIRAEEEAKAKAEAEARLRAEQQAAAVPAIPVVHQKAVTPAPITSHASDPGKVPTLNLGLINKALGFTVSADFLRSLGFAPISKGSERLYHEEDFPLICQAIVQHVNSVADGCCAQEAAK